MPVRRIAARAVKQPARRTAPSTPAGAYPALPDAPKGVVTDPLLYTLLLYGREKIGKTVWLSSFPETIFATFEPGTKGLRIFEYNAEDGGCRTWEHALAMLTMLEAEPGRFKTVVCDTADAMYDKCLDYVCRTLGIDHPGESADGKKDFGKSWKAIRAEFTRFTHRVLQSGRGLAFISHAKEETFRSRSGEEFTRIHPSMSGQARAIIEALVDMFFYCEYMRAPDGSTRRVLITEGDEIVWAGHRRIEGEDGVPVHLPRIIPITEEGGYQIYEAAFRGENVGLDPATLLPAKGASETVKQFFRGVRAAAGART